MFHLLLTAVPLISYNQANHPSISEFNYFCVLRPKHHSFHTFSRTSNLYFSKENLPIIQMQ